MDKERPRIDVKQSTSITENQHKPKQRKRVPVDMPHNPLEYPNKPGFHRHIFNDKPGRIERALHGGYQFVTKEMLQQEGFVTDLPLSQKEEVDNRVSWMVGQEDNGTPIRGYLMEIPEKYYKEDQDAREGRTLAIINEALRKGQEKDVPAKDELYPTGPGVKFGPDG